MQIGQYAMNTDRIAGRQLPRPLQRRLYLPAYSVQEAAYLAGTTRETVTRWCLGYSSRGHRLPAVIKGKQPWKPLSYLELVEVAFAATCRNLGMTLQRIRKAHDYLAKNFQEDYPFAAFKLTVNGAHILKDLQEIEGESIPLIVADEHGQLGWSPMVADRIDQFVWEFDVAMPWFPRGKSMRIMLDPRISFGAPTVADTGISTWTFRERYEAGETIDEIIDDFQVQRADVLLALEFEGIKIAA